jgi:hypothetical protein
MISATPLKSLPSGPIPPLSCRPGGQSPTALPPRRSISDCLSASACAWRAAPTRRRSRSFSLRDSFLVRSGAASGGAPLHVGDQRIKRANFASWARKAAVPSHQFVSKNAPSGLGYFRNRRQLPPQYPGGSAERRVCLEDTKKDSSTSGASSRSGADGGGAAQLAPWPPYSTHGCRWALLVQDLPCRLVQRAAQAGACALNGGTYKHLVSLCTSKKAGCLLAISIIPQVPVAAVFTLRKHIASDNCKRILVSL